MAVYTPRAVVFDLDGTLVDTLPDIASACNHALASVGRRTLKPEVIARYVGDGARKLCSRAAGLTDDDDQLDEVVDKYVTYYLEHPVVDTRWMPYAREMLDAITLRVAVCTNKPRVITERVLEALGVRDRFAAVVGGGDTHKSKPAGDMLVLVAQRLGIDPRELVMVGDSPQDILCGREVGARTIGYVSGYSARLALLAATPDIIVESHQEVVSIVSRWREATVRARVSSPGI